MAQIYLATGQKNVLEFRTEFDYNESCKKYRQQFGAPFFEMPWPNKKIFAVFRDGKDNEYELRFKPITIMESNPD